jgi:hypothetical protein
MEYTVAGMQGDLVTRFRNTSRDDSLDNITDLLVEFLNHQPNLISVLRKFLNYVASDITVKGNRRANLLLPILSVYQYNSPCGGPDNPLVVLFGMDVLAFSIVGNVLLHLPNMFTNTPSNIQKYDIFKRECRASEHGIYNIELYPKYFYKEILANDLVYNRAISFLKSTPSALENQQSIRHFETVIGQPIPDLFYRLYIEKKKIARNIYSDIITGGYKLVRDVTFDSWSTQYKTFIEEGKSTPFYKDEDVEIFSPKTREQACYYGRGTKWCTAVCQPMRVNLFADAIMKGPLYIIIPKKTEYDGEKYQLQLATRQYMNEQNKPIKLIDLLKRLPQIIPVIFKFVKKTKEYKIYLDEESYRYLINIKGHGIYYDEHDTNLSVPLEFYTKFPSLLSDIYNKQYNIREGTVFYNEHDGKTINNFAFRSKNGTIAIFQNKGDLLKTNISVSELELYRKYPSLLTNLYKLIKSSSNGNLYISTWGDFYMIIESEGTIRRLYKNSYPVLYITNLMNEVPKELLTPIKSTLYKEQEQEFDQSDWA